MSLINVNSLIANLIWILALAWLLAVISMTRWESHQRARSFREQINEPENQLRLMVGALVLCLGLGLVADATWLMAMWFMLGVVFLLLLILTARSLIK